MSPAAAPRKLRVILVSPLGRAGNGGIDRLMDSVCDAFDHSASISINRVTSRGTRYMAMFGFMPALIIRILLAGLLHRADVVHINLASRSSTYRKILIAATCRACGLPYLIHLHGAEFREFWGQCGKVRRAMIRTMLVHASRVLVLGTPWADFIRDIAPRASERTIILPNATAPQEAHPSSGDHEEIRILFIGRLGARKGTPQLISALAELRDLPGWKCVIAGDGEIDAARRAVATAGLAERIDVPGWMDAETTERMLREADILALPSFAENLPMSVIEGMAHGLAVVTTPVGATQDIIRDGETGLLVQPDDVEALSRALRSLITDSGLRKMLGTNARAFQKQHLSLPSYCNRLGEIWAEVASGSQTAPASSQHTIRMPPNKFRRP